MWQKLKEQLPAVVLTALLVGGAIFWFHQKTVQDLSARQQTEISALREQTNAELKAASEETRRHIESVNQLLKDAISKRSADVFMTDEEVPPLRSAAMDAARRRHRRQGYSRTPHSGSNATAPSIAGPTARSPTRPTPHRSTTPRSSTPPR